MDTVNTNKILFDGSKGYYTEGRHPSNLISFDTARLLYLHGYDRQIYGVYDKNGELTKFTHGPFYFSAVPQYSNKPGYPAPTLQEAITWIRKEKGMHIIPIRVWRQGSSELLWGVILQDITNENFCINPFSEAWKNGQASLTVEDDITKTFSTYDDALQYGLREALWWLSWNQKTLQRKLKAKNDVQKGD